MQGNFIKLKRELKSIQEANEQLGIRMLVGILEGIGYDVGWKGGKLKWAKDRSRRLAIG